MGYRGEEKRRQMVRSLLPSRAAKSARSEKRDLNRQVRAQSRAVTRAVLWSADETLANETAADETAADGTADVDVVAPRVARGPDRADRYADIETARRGRMKYAVNDRRNADKTHPFEKWAVAVTANIPNPESRRSKIAAGLPTDIIGYHTLQHIDRLDEFRVLYAHDWRVRHTPENTAARTARWEKKRAADEARYRRVLYDCCVSGWGQRVVNHVLREGHDAGRNNSRPFTPLAGTHDIDAFILRCRWGGTYSQLGGLVDAWEAGEITHGAFRAEVKRVVEVPMLFGKHVPLRRLTGPK